jgi:hypothetical protein
MTELENFVYCIILQLTYYKILVNRHVHARVIDNFLFLEIFKQNQ